MDFHCVPSHSAPFFFLAEAPEGPPLGVYRLRLQKDASRNAAETAATPPRVRCAAHFKVKKPPPPLNAAQMKAPISARRVSIMGPPPLPPPAALLLLLTIHTQPRPRAAAWGGVGGWVGVGWQKVMPGCQVSLKETRSVCVLKNAPPCRITVTFSSLCLVLMYVFFFIFFFFFSNTNVMCYFSMLSGGLHFDATYTKKGVPAKPV